MRETDRQPVKGTEVVAGKLLDSRQEGNHYKMSNKCPRTLGEMSPTPANTIFGRFHLKLFHCILNIYRGPHFAITTPTSQSPQQEELINNFLM